MFLNVLFHGVSVSRNKSKDRMVSRRWRTQYADLITLRDLLTTLRDLQIWADCVVCKGAAGWEILPFPRPFDGSRGSSARLGFPPLIGIS
ncbi:hypothetical protein RBSWK_01908 [Rhodopirellula baltica SWK14]|uniref:Uncharacterized protein n=1 Tax=Rhodopirellula baltica SWK14 TaxID=993516 RepID=L7CKL1_RHOBT|nr:hypothetical protein RBSWK_01908 [Rhodopirellula baltica SWK14]